AGTRGARRSGPRQSLWDRIPGPHVIAAARGRSSAAAQRLIASEGATEAPEGERPSEHLRKARAEDADLRSPVKIIRRRGAHRMGKKCGADREIAKCCRCQDFHVFEPGFGEPNSGYSVPAQLAIPKSRKTSDSCRCGRAPQPARKVPRC